jgi:hypothetical protein
MLPSIGVHHNASSLHGPNFYTESLAAQQRSLFLEKSNAMLRLGQSPIGGTSAKLMNETLIQEVLQRQRLMDASMSSTLSSGNVHEDAAYMNALAALRHREAMLNLDKAIHEAQKRRYTTNFSNSLSNGFIGSTSGLPSVMTHSLGSGVRGMPHLPTNLMLANAARSADLSKMIEMHQKLVNSSFPSPPQDRPSFVDLANTKSPKR